MLQNYQGGIRLNSVSKKNKEQNNKNKKYDDQVTDDIGNSILDEDDEKMSMEDRFRSEGNSDGSSQIYYQH